MSKAAAWEERFGADRDMGLLPDAEMLRTWTAAGIQAAALRIAQTDYNVHLVMQEPLPSPGTTRAPHRWQPVRPPPSAICARPSRFHSLQLQRTQHHHLHRSRQSNAAEQMRTSNRRSRRRGSTWSSRRHPSRIRAVDPAVQQSS